MLNCFSSCANYLNILSKGLPLSTRPEYFERRGYHRNVLLILAIEITQVLPPCSRGKIFYVCYSEHTSCIAYDV
jgi:hypothetical protein